MKKLVLILMTAMIIFTNSSYNVLAGESIAPTEGIRVYNTNYIKKHEKTLNAMFDNKWTLISTKNKYEEHEPMCAHVDTRPEQFIEWTIEYRDGNGAQRLFVFDNRYSLSGQIENYIEKYIAEYYEENFYDVYTRDMPLAPSCFVFCFFTRMSANRDDEDNQERVKKSDAYLEKLDTPDGTICLAKLTPANVFEMCPIYLSISINFSGHPNEKQAFEKNAMKQIEGMIASMNKFTNNKLNTDVSMGYHEIIDLHTGNRSYNWEYVQGKQIFNTGMYFERFVFDSYKGVFW